MASDIKKFINPKFLRTIDLALMKDLFARHFGEDDLPVPFDAETAAVRQALTDYFDSPVTEWSEGVIADLHRVAELGSGEGMQIILNEARRQDTVLYPETESDIEVDAPVKHDAKHVALHTYLHHHRVFEAAADFQALRAPNAMAEFRGPERDTGVDLTPESKAAFQEGIRELLAQDLHGEYCRLGPYEEEGEINLVVSHGAPVTTTPVVVGGREEIITLRGGEIRRPALFPRPRACFGSLASRRPGRPMLRSSSPNTYWRGRVFFAGKDARDLYTLDPISEVGPDFAFNHASNEQILEVRIVAAAADHFERDEAEGNMALRADMGVEGCLRRGASAFQGQRGALRTWLATPARSPSVCSSGPTRSGRRRLPCA